MKSRSLAWFALLGVASVPQARAQLLSAPASATLHSRILAEDRTVFIALPESYERRAGRFPVVYVTDAEWNFAHTRTSAQLLARNQIIPEVIVVGVPHRDRVRDLYATRADFTLNGRTIPFPTSGKADPFLQFLERELIPWVERSYRTSGLRVLAGHSAGGNFALHAMRTKPGLFQAVIAASPWLAWDEKRELRELLPFVTSPQLRVRALFLSHSGETPNMKPDVDALVAALKQRSDSSVRWVLREYPDETHDTNVLKSFYDGLRMVFAGHAPPRGLATRR